MTKARAASGQEVRAVINALDPVLDKDREAPTRQRQRHIYLYTIRYPVNMIRCPVAQMPPPLVVINLDQECSWFRNRIKINCCYHYLCFCVLYLNLCWFNCCLNRVKRLSNRLCLWYLYLCFYLYWRICCCFHCPKNQRYPSRIALLYSPQGLASRCSLSQALQGGK